MAAAGPLFGIFFVGATPPITEQAFVRVDPQHWVRSCCA